MARSTKQPRAAAVDLEEIAPDRFLVHTPRINALIKSEGEITGRLFQLTSWRRDGMIARLRERGFEVRTLADRLAKLPGPPPAPSIGGPGWRPLSSPIEQISHFDLRALRWHPLAPETRDGVSGVILYDGWVLRRRKGRAGASFYLAFKERGGGIALRSLTETEALLAGYAQALAHDPRPLLVERRGDQVVLPDVELPPPYRELLASIAKAGADGPLVDMQAWPLARELFERLGVRLNLGDE
ncbi:MAG TPA: hypothetical protein VFU22_33630 [Roseiflexaceae bacterium]|nr:hypothetical protein [Roseiflexaceae bacterium]